MRSLANTGVKILFKTMPDCGNKLWTFVLDITDISPNCHCHVSHSDKVFFDIGIIGTSIFFTYIYQAASYKSNNNNINSCFPTQGKDSLGFYTGTGSYTMLAQYIPAQSASSSSSSPPSSSVPTVPHATEIQR